MTSGALRAQWTWTTSAICPRRARLRSMLMIGVTPLPALTNSSRAGSGSGSTNVPSTPPRRTIAPGFMRPQRWGETLPPSTSFGVMAMHPSGRLGVGGQRVGAPVMDPVDLDPEAEVLPRKMSRPFPARLDRHRGRRRARALDALDPPAELARGPQRVDHLEVVVRQQRRRERADHPQRRATCARDLGCGAALSHGSAAWGRDGACSVGWPGVSL